MDGQHPKITLGWALRSLERALENLEDGWAERRVRRQFHQLLLAIEREAVYSRDRQTDRIRVDEDVAVRTAGRPE